MLISVLGLVGGFILWLCVRRRLQVKTGQQATVIFFVCLIAGLLVGLWGDADTIRAVVLAINHGPASTY